MKLLAALPLGLMIGLVGCSGQPQGTRPSNPKQQETTNRAATLQPAASVQPPHAKTTEEVWHEATPATRRSLLAKHIHAKWKNVGVEDSGVIMTITHPGMDESGAQQIIDDISNLASEAGLRRINLVRAGGICQVTYERPYCESACEEKMHCSPVGSEACNLLCCSIHGYPVEHISEVREEPCPTHTWVYDVPTP